MRSLPLRPSDARPQSAGVGLVMTILLLVVFLFGLALLAYGGPEEGKGTFPSRPSDLFRLDKVWSLHLRLTPEAWAAMEPAGGMSFFDPSSLGLGMFLTPTVMSDGDRDKDGRLSSEEFRSLGERWFADWDGDKDNVLDAKQIREGLKGKFRPPGSEESGGPPPGMTLQGSKGKRNGLSAMMGVEFVYVHAGLEFEGKAFGDVAVRYKGNGTFMESRSSLKRSLKLVLNKFTRGAKLAGVTTLNLHNNVTDAGMMNEVLSYALYRAAGVPAPRTAYARVYVTVPGKYERKYFGLYSLVENVDRNFVSDRGLSRGGAIFKPSMPNLFADLGDEWEKYEQGYDPKTDLTPEQERRVIALSRLITRGSDDEVAARLGEFIDLDEFARFLAVSTWIGDLDSLLTTGQNFYLYLDPKTDRFQFIPWDKDHTFGSWGGGDTSERVGHSIRQPWEGRKRFLERAFKVAAFRDRYLAAMGRIAEEVARPERIEASLKEVAASIRPAVMEESSQKLSRFDAVVAGKPLAGGFFGLGKETPTLLMFVKDRAASVKDQLAGKSQGIVLGRRRPGQPDRRPEFRPEEMMEPIILKALDVDKDGKLRRDEFVGGFVKWFATWDAGKAGSLSEEQVRKGLNKALPFSPFMFRPPGGGDRKPPEAKKPAGEKAPGKP